MSITSSGVWCDFCSDSISVRAFMNEIWDSVLEGIENNVDRPEGTYIEVKVEGFDRKLQCCTVCEPTLREATTKGDWKLLPEGPVKEKFQEASDKYFPEETQ